MLNNCQLQSFAGPSYSIPMALVAQTNRVHQPRTVSTASKKRYISNVQSFLRSSDISLFFLTSLGSKKYELKRLVSISIKELSDGEYLASFEAAGISITGDTPQDAIRLFKSELIKTYEIYKREQLGAGPKKQLAVLEKYIGKKGRQ